MRTRVGRVIVQGDGYIDPVQICRCHTNRRAKKGQILYKHGYWKLTNKDIHLTGCPVLINYARTAKIALTTSG